MVYGNVEGDTVLISASAMSPLALQMGVATVEGFASIFMRIRATRMLNIYIYAINPQVSLGTYVAISKSFKFL
jgi:hypothetical protein